MGLFSNLLGNAGKDIDLNKLAKQVGAAAEAIANEAEKAAKQAAEKAAEGKAAPAQRDASPAPREESAAPSGLSWGEEMPEEENQFNFNGSYQAYFEHIFAADFPAYGVEKESKAGSRRAVYTLTQGGRKALVVEVMSETSSAQRVRKACAAENVPYLRFYHDHSGWWNTRSYVTGRIRAALG